MIVFARYLRLVVLTCLVAGCSASGADFELSAAPEGQGIIHIYRVNSFTGYSDAPDVKIDGKLIGTLKNAGFLTATVDPGPHEIEVRVEFMKLFGGRKVSVDVAQAGYKARTIAGFFR